MIKRIVHDFFAFFDKPLHRVIDNTPVFSRRNRIAGWLHYRVHDACYLFSSDPQIIELKARLREAKRTGEN